jgi:hypothetical protein
MTPEERKKVNKKVVFFAGKAAPAYYVAKLVRLPSLQPHLTVLILLCFL